MLQILLIQIQVASIFVNILMVSLLWKLPRTLLLTQCILRKKTSQTWISQSQACVAWHDKKARYERKTFRSSNTALKTWPLQASPGLVVNDIAISSREEDLYFKAVQKFVSGCSQRQHCAGGTAYKNIYYNFEAQATNYHPLGFQNRSHFVL